MQETENNISFVPTIIVPILVTITYALTFWVAFSSLAENPILFPIIDFTSVVSCVFIAQMLVRKSNLQVSFKKLWLSGWMSSLVLGVLVIQFQKLYFNKLSDATPLVETYSQLLIVYNLFGLMLSALFAFILKKM